MSAVFNWQEMVAKLNSLIKLRSTPVGMKLFTSVEEMQQVPKLRMVKDTLLLCQVVGQAVRMGLTVGATNENFGSPQCGAILGFTPHDQEWAKGEMYKGVWFTSLEDTKAHQQSLHVVPYGKYKGVVISPLNSERLNPPDVCLIYATPGQMFILCSGLLSSGYKKMVSTNVGESSCADAWGKALTTGEPSMSLPCFAERRFAGVSDDEMLLALTPQDLAKAITGMEWLSSHGLRYPIPPYGTQMDVRAGMVRNYSDKEKK